MFGVNVRVLAESLARHLCSKLGAALVTAGWLTGSDLEIVAGALVGLAGVAASLAEKALRARVG